ncbi:MAG: PEGA domain-containing protein [Breznakibacter sp.]
MTSMQEDKLSMYYVVKGICEKYQSVWAANVVFAATYDLWVAKIPLIEQNRDVQTMETSGVTTDKKSKRAAMVEGVLFIAKRLQSYAHVAGDPEILESVRYSASDMKKARDTDVVGICNAVLTRANANVTALAAYGVTPALISESQAAITAYSATLSKPTAAKAQTKTATENLARLFKEADDLLVKRLDLDIELFKVTDPDFYSQYRTGRIIVSTGKSVAALLGSVTVAGSSETLKGVVFTFSPENGGASKTASVAGAGTLVKKSAQKGNFRILSMPEGAYMVTVKKVGYKDQVVTVYVANGETTSLKIEMERN